MSATADTGITVPVTCREDLDARHRQWCADGEPLGIAARCHTDAPMYPDYHAETGMMVLCCSVCGGIGMIVPICSYGGDLPAA
jgi:hypothetical protein